MNFVLTGHKGLIGSALLKRLLARGDEPVALIDLRSEPASSDIRDLRLTMMNRRIDVVYHLASFCKINQCIEDPDLPLQHNVIGTDSVMRFCVLNNVKKIVFTSSTRVLYPEKNPYTASKIYGEEIVQSYGLDYTIVRPSTVYGPFDDKTKRLVHLWINAALDNEELKIYGDEHKTLDFTYVDDFVDALLEASTHSNSTFNIGTGREVRLVDVAKAIINVVGMYQPGKSGRIAFYPAEKLQPQNVVVNTDIPCDTWAADGLAQTIAFYQRQRNARPIIP